MERKGIAELWETILRFRDVAAEGGGLDRHRAEQRLAWLWNAVGDQVVSGLRQDPRHRALARQVEEGAVSPAAAAAEIAGTLGLEEPSPT